MNKNYVENSLKRFLKRKVKITLGMVVAFLITGAVGFAETINDPIRGTKGEILEVIIGSEEYNPDVNITGNIKLTKTGKLNAKLSGTDSLLNGKIETANTAESNIDFLDGAKWDNT